MPGEGSSGGRNIEPSEMRSVAKVDVAFFGADFSQHGDPVYIGECTRGLRAAYFGGDRREKATISDVFEQEVRGQHQFPQELPGSKHILFTWWSPPESEIRLLSLETGEFRTLITDASHARYVPSGHIVFAWEGALHAVRFDLERLEVASCFLSPCSAWQNRWVYTWAEFTKVSEHSSTGLLDRSKSSSIELHRCPSRCRDGLE